jgi:hypothetical protein
VRSHSRAETISKRLDLVSPQLVESQYECGNGSVGSQGVSGKARKGADSQLLEMLEPNSQMVFCDGGKVRIAIFPFFSFWKSIRKRLSEDLPQFASKGSILLTLDSIAHGKIGR